MTHLLNKLPFAHHGWFMYLRLLVRHFNEDNCTQKAASLTYTTLLSIVPMIAVVIMVVSTVPALADFREQIQQTIYSNLLPSSSRQISEYLNGFAEKSVKMSVVGVGALLFTTIMTLITVETAFNQIWRIEDASGGIKSVLRFFVMVVATPVILAVAFWASSAVQSIDFLNRQYAGYGINWTIWIEILSFVVTVAGFTGMYWFIPKIKVPLKNAVIAGIVIAIIFECVKRIFGLAITNFTSYEAVYGAFAALPIFLMWVYISWNLILIGVEISYTLTIFETKEVPVRHPLLSLLDMLNLAYKNYQNDKSTSEKDFREVLGRKELPKWQAYLTQLEQNHLIKKLDNDEYTLKTDLNTINLWELHKVLPYPLPIKEELILLKEADYDPWYVEIYDRLNEVEEAASTHLNTPLAYLFDTAPLRPKRTVGALVADSEASQEHVDNIGRNHASFDESASVTQGGSDTDEELVIPDGKAAFTEGKLGKLVRYGKMLHHFIGRGRGALEDVKRNFR